MIITQTPLRVSFFGGGTDYPEYFLNNGGAVLGSAINKSVFFSVSKFYSELFDYNIRISYRKVETVNAVDKIKHAPFRECLRWCGLERDVEINHMAELPAFTGLGSSSTFVVGLLNSIYAYKGRLIAPLEVAYQAIRLEREVLKDAVGCQDQVFAAMGGLNMIEFRKMDNIIVNRLPVSRQRVYELESHLMMFFTGIKRKAEEIATHQIRSMDRNAPRLKKMRAMVDEGVNILVNNGALDRFGELLDRAWMEKRELDSRITNSKLDTLYEAGKQAGAIGGKLLGAGGGGFMLFYVPPEKQDAVRQRLKRFKEVPVKLDAPGTHVIHT